MPLVAVFGIATSVWRRALPYAVALAVVAYIGHVSIGLRLPQRVFAPDARTSNYVRALRAIGDDLAKRRVPANRPVIADGCLGVRVPYLVRHSTLISGADWQVGFERLRPAARTAAVVLAGGPEGRRKARTLGVPYLVVDPRCSRNVAVRTGGKVAFRSADLEIIELPGS
jgi:hypothetical protein